MNKALPSILVVALCVIGFQYSFANEYKDRTFKAGHQSLQDWVLPEFPPTPDNNKLTPERIDLGKKLFFDPRLSGDKNMSCATCHSPLFGWSDALPTAKGNKSMILGRASPVITNAAYNSIQMWDGRKKSLEDQAMGPMVSVNEMNMNIPRLMAFLNADRVYSSLFKKAYPNEKISDQTLAKAIASFERTIISRTSPFDQWIQGDKKAMTEEQINGFKVFSDPQKGNCEVCHSSPNFTDVGFHNLGLASFDTKTPDLGRYSQRPLGLMKGAFKTPTLRDITLSSPYFHDGSAKTLEEVIKHYKSGGKVKSNISPNFKAVNITDEEMKNLVSFMEALTSPQETFLLPILPLTH